MRHAVLGAGGVSGLVGGALAQTGHPVTLLVRPGRSERVLPGTIRVEAEQVEPGRVRQLSSFVNVQDASSLAARERAEVLCSELRAARLSCEVSNDEVTLLWGKLCSGLRLLLVPNLPDYSA